MYNLKLKNEEHQFSSIPLTEDLEREQRRREYEEDDQSYNDTEQPTNNDFESNMSSTD